VILANELESLNLCEALKSSLKRHGKSLLLRFEELQDLFDLFGEPEVGPAVDALQEELKSVEFTKWKELILKKKA